MFVWTPERLRFRVDAARFGSFYREIAQEIAARVPASAHICDAGCGTGDLARVLAASFAQVTALDHDLAALRALREDCPPNVTALCRDALTDTPSARYDAMVFCFFGSAAEILSAAKRQCRGTVIAVKKQGGAHRFSPGCAQARRDSLQTLENELAARGIDYTCVRRTLDLGQPFRTLEDAVRFFRLYHRGGDESNVSSERVAALLRPINHSEFRYYYPAETSVGLLFFNLEE